MAEFRHAFSTAENTAATISIHGDGASGTHTITVYAVQDADASATPVTVPGVLHQAAAGTATLTVLAAGSNTYETVYQSDGTTPVSIDFTTATPASVILTGTYKGFKATPSSLDADCVVYMGVSTDKNS